MATELAKAYVQIIPSAEGIKGKLSGIMDSEASAAGKSSGSAFSSSFGGIVAGAGKLAAAAFGATTVAAGAFAKSAIDAGMSFDKSMSQVAATMGDNANKMIEYNGETTDSMSALRDYAQEMGRTTAFSASQAADALNYMALAGYDADTSMKMLPNVLNLAAAGGIELATASDMVTDAQTALGLSIDETSAMVDQMAKASSMSNTSVQQLGDAFLTVGANARGIKGGTQELSQVLGVLADNGIKGSEAGTHLRNIMLAMNPTTDAAVAAWKSLGVEAYDAEGNLKSLPGVFVELNNAMADMTSQEKKETLSAMFNKTDLASVEALLGTEAERFGELARGIKAAGFNIDSFKSSFKDLGGNFDQIQTAVNALGDVNLTDNLPRYLEWCEGDAQKLAEAMYEDSDASTSYNDIVNALGGDLNVLQQALDNTTGAAQAMADTQLDNLSGDITMFQSALEGLQLAFQETVDGPLREFVKFGTEGISSITEAFKSGGIEGALNEFSNVLTTGLDKILKGLPEGVKVVTGIIESIASHLPELMATLTNALIDALPPVIDGIVKVVPDIIKALTQLIVIISGRLPEIIVPLIKAIPQIIPPLVQGLMTALPALINGIIQLQLGIVNALPQIIPPILDALPDIVAMIVAGLMDCLPQLIIGIVQVNVALAAAIVQNIPLFLEAIGQIFTSVIGVIAEKTADIRAKIAETASNVVTTIQTFLSPYNLGFIVGQAIASIGTAFENLIPKTKEVFEKALDKVKDFGKRLKSEGPEMAKTFVKDFLNSFKELGSGLYKAGLEAIDSLWKGISEKWGWLKDQVKGMVSSLTQGIKDGFNGAGSSNSSTASTTAKAVGSTSARSATALRATSVTNETSNTFNNTITVNGAQDPEAWTRGFVRTLNRQAIMANG